HPGARVQVRRLPPARHLDPLQRALLHERTHGDRGLVDAQPEVVAQVALGRDHIVLMRKDPPVDAEYIHDTQILGIAQQAGARVVNDPQGLRDYNEKLAALLFPQCCPPTVVTRDIATLKAFVADHGQAVLKPLDGMGGRSIFRASRGEANLNVILETLTNGGHGLAMAQRYIPEITTGDKRILLIDGEPVDYCLARIPQGDEFRGNLATGGRGEGRPLSERDRWIAAQVGPEMKRRGMVFVGLDVIGDYLTEVNVTSPTCIRELDAQFGLNIAGVLFDAIEARHPGPGTGDRGPGKEQEQAQDLPPDAMRPDHHESAFPGPDARA
ncbi:MAG: glutathione synthase, partial [Proteobacteria bacterium]|nr:glutathione synthase [Pseudomonadota bacterium]